MRYALPVVLFALAAPAVAQESIRWQHAVDDAIPQTDSEDLRPTILYFTFDT